MVCYSVSTTTAFTTEACQKTFKNQKDPLNCDSERVLCSLKYKACSEVPYFGKAKIKFCYSSTITKVNIEHSEKGSQKVPEKRFHTHYCLDGHSGIDDWNFVLFEQGETHEQFKERETFWQHRLKTFYPVALNEKEEYLY